MTDDVQPSLVRDNNRGLRPQLSKGLLVRAAGWSALQAWGIRLVTLGVFVLLARLLEPKDIGLVGMAAVFVSFVQVILETAFGEAIVQRNELTDSHLNAAFWLNTTAGVLLFVAVFYLAEPIALLMREPRLADCIRVLATSFVLAALGSVPQAYLKRRFQFKVLALRSLVASVISSLLAVILALLHFGIWALIAQSITFTAVGSLLVWINCDWRPRLSFSKKHVSEIGFFAANSFGTRSVDFLSNRMPDFLIGYLFGAQELGFFTVGSKLVIALNQMITFVATQVSLSALAGLQTDTTKFRRAYVHAIKITSVIAFPTFCAVALLAGEIIPALFGNRWAPSIPILEVYALFGALLSTTYLTGTAITAIGKPSMLLGLTLIETATRIGAILMAAQFGMQIAVMAYVTAAFCTAPLGWITLNRIAGLSAGEIVRSYSGALAGVTAMAAGLLLTTSVTYPNGWSHIGVIFTGTTLSVVLYGIAVRVADRESTDAFIQLGMTYFRRMRQRQ